MTNKPALKWRQFNDEVLYGDEPIVHVDRDFIEFLKRRADANPRRRIRLCAHRAVDDRVHEMIIVHAAGTYVKPHKHVGKIESFHIVEGEADVVIFDDAGNVTRVVPMGPAASGKTFYYRLADPLFHTLLIHTDYIVFHETTSGPFRREETVFAPWAPDDTDAAAARAFMEKTAEAVRKRS